MHAQSAISNVIKALDILLFNTVDELQVDWTPAQGEIVLYRSEKGEWETGAYQSLWADLRPLRFEGDNRAANFEPSPYHGDQTVMAKVNRATSTGKNEWEIDYVFSYVAIEDILKYEPANIEYAMLSNQAHKNSLVA